MTQSKLVVPALLALLSGGASCTDPLGPERTELAQARERWEAAALSDYRFDYRLSCFCGSPANRDVTVEVRDGAVVAATFHDDGPAATVHDVEGLSTIDELFDRIERTLEQEPEQFTAEYDATFGHPISVSADIAFNISDEEFAFRVDDLASLAP
ncbi:MAG: DUF6174 domain-containing protein [Gemmatimonadota bacterium]